MTNIRAFWIMLALIVFIGWCDKGSGSLIREQFTPYRNNSNTVLESREADDVVSFEIWACILGNYETSVRATDPHHEMRCPDESWISSAHLDALPRNYGVHVAAPWDHAGVGAVTYTDEIGNWPGKNAGIGLAVAEPTTLALVAIGLAGVITARVRQIP